MEMKNPLAIGIIFLFIGIAVAPSINSSTVKTIDNSDLVEVTSQACGIQGYRDATVNLTRAQYQELAQYLADVNARLNQTTTRDEAVPIFKEAVVELHKYGLLPKGMSITRAQRLVTGSVATSRLARIQPRSTQVRLNEVDNQFCLVAGTTDNAFIFGPIKSSLFLLLMLITYVNYGIATLFDNLGLRLLAGVFYGIDTVLEWLWIPTRVIPFEIGGLVTMGSYYYEWEVGPHFYPSDGWITTQGLQGKQSINGSFFGNLKNGGGLGLFFGMYGYTGFVLHPVTSYRAIFLGSALRAAMSDTPPYASEGFGKNS